MAENESQKRPQGEADDLSNIAFHYIKSNYFRVIHGAGGFGSVSFDGQSIRMAIYTERVPIPLMQVWQCDPKGDLVKEIATTGREGVVREVEAEIVMSVTVARNLAKWLLEQANTADQFNASNDNLQPENK